MSNNAPDYENDLVFPPQEIKSQDDLNKQGRESDVLISAIERCERLEKALYVAVCTLETYADTQNWRDIFEEDGDDSEYHTEALYFANEGYESAQSALKQIKELDK